jgi:hypothetical protein
MDSQQRELLPILTAFPFNSPGKIRNSETNDVINVRIYFGNADQSWIEKKWGPPIKNNMLRQP